MMIWCDDNSLYLYGKWAIIDFYLSPYTVNIQYILLSCLFNKSFTIWQSTWLPPRPTSWGWRQRPNIGFCWPCDTSPSWPRTRRRPSRCYTSPGSPPCQSTLRIRRKLLIEHSLNNSTPWQAINQFYTLSAVPCPWRFNFPDWPFLTFLQSGLALTSACLWAEHRCGGTVGDVSPPHGVAVGHVLVCHLCAQGHSHEGHKQIETDQVPMHGSGK